MILIDANLLLFAVNRDLFGHFRARSWFEGVRKNLVSILDRKTLSSGGY